MDFVFLADHEDAIPTIAGWYFAEWGHITKLSAEAVAAKMRDALNRDKIPLFVLAVEGEEILGVAGLKCREMPIYPDKEHWIGGVFVPPTHRGKGIASRLAKRIVEIAGSLGVRTLHLQTSKLNGGLYARLGWVASEQVNYRGLDVLVMEKQLGA
jgi:GNAT superfamily N-acetyltransferase